MKRISLVISDVDGTLVTPDKRLTDATVRAVRLLQESGIQFTVNSSRPPMGVRMLIEPLSLRLPIGTFNGGAIVGPDLTVIEQHLVPESAARCGVDLLNAFGADVWVFTTDRWLLRNVGGENVPREKRAIQAEPVVVSDFDPYLARAAKIVGASMDFARLTECETVVRDTLNGTATVVRSQRYYLDITSPHTDKGTVVDHLSNRLAVPIDAIATLGDMENDLPMFRNVGLSIAMGNASAQVKQQANFVTTSNAEEGFARAIEYVLGRTKTEKIA